MRCSHRSPTTQHKVPTPQPKGAALDAIIFEPNHNGIDSDMLVFAPSPLCRVRLPAALASSLEHELLELHQGERHLARSLVRPGFLDLVEYLTRELVVVAEELSHLLWVVGRGRP